MSIIKEVSELVKSDMEREEADFNENDGLMIILHVLPVDGKIEILSHTVGKSRLMTNLVMLRELVETTQKLLKESVPGQVVCEVDIDKVKNKKGAD